MLWRKYKPSHNLILTSLLLKRKRWDFQVTLKLSHIYAAVITKIIYKEIEGYIDKDKYIDIDKEL